VLYLVITFVTKGGNVLELKILKDIPFLTGNLANMFLMGSLYSALMLKILYLQWLMGFTAVHSGHYQAVLAGTMLVFSIIAGILTDKINPRWPVILGLPVCIYGLFMASRLSLASDMGSILIIGVIMGAGIAFVAMPISVAVFTSISRKDMGAASVLNSYLSVISASVCLAIIMTLLIHRMDVNSLYLARAITSGNLAFEQAVHATSPDIAMVAAYGQMMRQAAMFAFNDVWYLMAFVLILLIMYLPFMKKPRASSENNNPI
jgi:DHA2 family multidrug resistance protein